MKAKPTKGTYVYCEEQPNNIAIVTNTRARLDLIGNLVEVNFGTESEPIMRDIHYKHLFVSKYSQEQMEQIRESAPELLKELTNMVECWDNDTLQDIDIEEARKAIEKATE